MRKLAAMALLGMAVGGFTMHTMDRATTPQRAMTTVTAVCHSTAEDAVITDCDYHDGGWYRR